MLLKKLFVQKKILDKYFKIIPYGIHYLHSEHDQDSGFPVTYLKYSYNQTGKAIFLKRFSYVDDR